jgi:phenylalanyl-tRNA synthetase beta chain
MPTIELSKKDLENQIGKMLSQQELEQVLPYAKCEYDGGEGDLIKADCKDTNRPDLWCVEGIARQIAGGLGKQTGVPQIKVHKSDYLVRVDPQLKNIRPRTACAVIKNIKITDEVLKQIIQMQEKISGSFGRNRKEAAIGVYDFDKIKWPINYSAFDPNKLKFTPLEMNVPLTLRQILVKHPKGREFAHLLEGHKKYPVFIDSDKNVLSMPPIINSNYSGKVTSNTKNLFIEVSGLSDKFILTALTSFVAALSDRGGQIYEVHVKYGLSEKICSPDFKFGKIKVSKDKFVSLTGLDLTSKQIVDLLKNARLNATVSGLTINVEYPAYRSDIMHEVDIIEDALIAYGYNNIEPEIPKMSVIGEETTLEVFSRKIREFMIGFGAQEILSFTLTNKFNLFSRMNMISDKSAASQLKPTMNLENQKCVEIANPVSQNWAVLRNWVIPSLIEFLSNNTTKEYPQRIFEVGDVVILNPKAETSTDTVRRLCFATTHKNANFTEIKQVLRSLLDGLAIQFTVDETEHDSFIPGRVGAIKVGEKQIGIIGDIHPQVLKNWKLDNPIAVFEINLSQLLN